MSDNPDPEAETSEDAEYQAVLMLDELESLLEEIEEYGGERELPDDIVNRMSRFGVADERGLRDRIVELHTRLDADEG